VGTRPSRWECARPESLGRDSRENHDLSSDKSRETNTEAEGGEKLTSGGTNMALELVEELESPIMRNTREIIRCGGARGREKNRATPTPIDLCRHLEEGGAMDSEY